MVSNMTVRLAFRLTLNHILYITFLMKIQHNLCRKMVTKKKITILIAKNIYLVGFHKLYKKTAFNHFFQLLSNNSKTTTLFKNPATDCFTSHSTHPSSSDTTNPVDLSSFSYDVPACVSPYAFYIPASLSLPARSTYVSCSFSSQASYVSAHAFHFSTTHDSPFNCILIFTTCPIFSY